MAQGFKQLSIIVKTLHINFIDTLIGSILQHWYVKSKFKIFQPLKRDNVSREYLSFKTPSFKSPDGVNILHLIAPNDSCFSHEIHQVTSLNIAIFRKASPHY